MKHLAEKISRGVKEKKETESSKEKIKKAMAEYVSDLGKISEEKYQELNRLMDLPLEKRNSKKNRLCIANLWEEIREIDAQLEPGKECLEFMEQEGDDLEIEFKDKK